MRKALIGFLLGATLATPVAAFAQENEVSQARAERRQERIEQRTERRQERTEQRTQERTERRQERTEQPRREPGVPVIEGRARTFPGHDERARRVITEARQERREDRTERREDRREDRIDRRGDRREDRLERREDRVERRDDRRDTRWDRREDRRDDRADRREHRRDWNRDWRSDRRYDWQRYRYSNRNAFRLGRYYSPYRNHSYSRFSIGLRLGSGFYSDRYWINDPWQYRLPPAYAGTRWVRYYDDVLLVDLYTGEVIDVIHGFFW